MMPKRHKRDEEKVFVGVDPGKTGGLCVICTDGTIQYSKMPPTERDIWGWFDSLLMKFGVIDFAYIEKVHAMPGQGVTSMFSFGQNYGFLRACLIAAEIPFNEATPRTWQKQLDIPAKPKAMSKPDHKLVLLAKAQQLFPQEELWKEPRSKGKQLAVCDAILLAEFCRRIHK